MEFLSAEKPYPHYRKSVRQSRTWRGMTSRVGSDFRRFLLEKNPLFATLDLRIPIGIATSLYW